jgi:hypothetical protein
MISPRGRIPSSTTAALTQALLDNDEKEAKTPENTVVLAQAPAPVAAATLRTHGDLRKKGAAACGTFGGLFGASGGFAGFGFPGLAGCLAAVPAALFGYYVFKVCDNDPARESKPHSQCTGFRP